MTNMDGRAPVERSYLVRDAKPREVYDVVVDFEAYPRLFPEFKAANVRERQGGRVRVEFRVDIVIAVRYVLDLVCVPDALTVDWTYVEGEIVVDSSGGWRFSAEPLGTKIDYRASVLVKAPLPGFVVRKATDALVAASIPNMFAAVEREVRVRRNRPAQPPA